MSDFLSTLSNVAPYLALTQSDNMGQDAQIVSQFMQMRNDKRQQLQKQQQLQAEQQRQQNINTAAHEATKFLLMIRQMGQQVDDRQVMQTMEKIAGESGVSVQEIMSPVHDNLKKWFDAQKSQNDFANQRTRTGLEQSVPDLAAMQQDPTARMQWSKDYAAAGGDPMKHLLSIYGDKFTTSMDLNDGRVLNREVYPWESTPQGAMRGKLTGTQRESWRDLPDTAEGVKVQQNMLTGKKTYQNPPPGDWNISTETNPDGTTKTVFSKAGKSGSSQTMGDALPSTLSGYVGRDMLFNTQQLDLVREMKTKYDKEFVTLPGRIKTFVLNVKDLFSGSPGVKDLNHEQRDYLSSAKAFYRTNAQAANAYIKAVTGAQMSEKEAQRILRAYPNAFGSEDTFLGWLHSDGPVAFESKMDDLIKVAELGQARFIVALEDGLISTSMTKEESSNAIEANYDAFVDESGQIVVSDDTAKELILSTADIIERKFKASGKYKDEEELKGAVKNYMQQNFSSWMPNGN